jgi:hypothetical protein
LLSGGWGWINRGIDDSLHARSFARARMARQGEGVRRAGAVIRKSALVGRRLGFHSVFNDYSRTTRDQE